MISTEALNAFKEIWAEEFGQDISDEVAIEEAVNLLTVFNAIYCPIKREWIEEYENANRVENQPISTSCKSGAATF